MPIKAQISYTKLYYESLISCQTISLVSYVTRRLQSYTVMSVSPL